MPLETLTPAITKELQRAAGSAEPLAPYQVWELIGHEDPLVALVYAHQFGFLTKLVGENNLRPLSEIEPAFRALAEVFWKIHTLAETPVSAAFPAPVRDGWVRLRRNATEMHPRMRAFLALLVRVHDMPANSRLSDTLARLGLGDADVRAVRRLAEGAISHDPAVVSSEALTRLSLITGRSNGPAADQTVTDADRSAVASLMGSFQSCGASAVALALREAPDRFTPDQLDWFAKTYQSWGENRR